jgi:hypothetical protein
MHVASKIDTFKLLSRFMDPKDIPAEYGGELQYDGGMDANRWDSDGGEIMRSILPVDAFSCVLQAPVPE